MMGETLEEVLNHLEETKPLLVLSTGSNDVNSDSDILLIYRNKNEVINAYNQFNKSEIIEKLIQRRITLYFQSQEDFSKEKYREGAFGIGYDTGWGKLAPSIRTHYILSSSRVLYSQNDANFDANNFIREALSKFEFVPLNESYELYLTAKWNDLLEYLETREDSKLAKATLRLIYSLLTSDDGMYRSTYEKIEKDAVLINMGKLGEYFRDQATGEKILKKLVDVKKGKDSFTEKEKRTLEKFIFILGSGLDFYKVFLNVSGDLFYRKEIKDYIDERIKKFGADRLLKLLNVVEEDNEIPLLYTLDLIEFLKPQNIDASLLERIKKKYEIIFNFGKSLNKEENLISLCEFLKIKYYLNEVSAEELKNLINKIDSGSIRIDRFVYSHIAFDRSEQAKKKILYDLYILLSKVKGDYNNKDLQEKIEEGLIWDPFNEEGIEEWIKYIKPNFKYSKFNVFLHDGEFVKLYKEILKKHLKLRVETEKGLVDHLVLIRKKFETRSNLSSYISSTAFNEEISDIAKEYKLKLDEQDYLLEELDSLFEDRTENQEEILLSWFGEFYEMIHKYEMRLSEVLLLEHSITSEWLKVV